MLFCKGMDFMKIAIDEARKGIEKQEGGPFGAVIVKDGKIISKAHNKVLESNDPTAHAEILAIRKAAKRLGTHNLEGCELYSTSQPCPMCLSAILWARIKKLYFGCSANDASKIGFDDSEIYKMLKSQRKMPLKQEQLSRKECLELFDEWKRKKGKLY